MDRFAGKTVLVTGAGQGIGRETARQFAREGADLVIVDLDPGRVRDATGEIRGAGGQAEGLALDISRPADVRQAVERSVSRFGKLDVLVANAGITAVEPFLEIDEKSWRRVLDVNLTGTFFCLQEAARAMAKSGGGAMVVTASTNAFWVEATLAAYNASKGAVVALVRTAALDLAPYGIRVNAVEPGVVRTPLAAFLTEDPSSAAEYLKKIPLGRFAEPLEIARAILFLASPDASYVTGQALVLDGGLTLGLPLDPSSGALFKAPPAR
jgi:NAD(P)-dependent dehydrogenase (short-subunit alcohol dehydrogenase family)